MKFFCSTNVNYSGSILVIILFGVVTLGAAISLMIRVINSYGVETLFTTASLRNLMSSWGCYNTFRTLFPIAIVSGLGMTTYCFIQNEREVSFC